MANIGALQELLTVINSNQQTLKAKLTRMWVNAKRGSRPVALCSTPQSLADAHY